MLKTAQPAYTIAVIAHPDDEAFMFGGTLKLRANKNMDVHLIYAHSYENEMIRVHELRSSCAILGVCKEYGLGLKAGDFGHHNYFIAAERLESAIRSIAKQYPNTAAEIITIEPRGVSGHFDHMFVSMVTTYVFYRLPDICGKLKYFCKSTDQKPDRNPDYFVYSPPGYPTEQIDESCDISEVWPQKRAAILAHKTQITDQQAQVDGRPLSYFNPEHFIVLEQDYKGQKME